ncbi:DoxX family protein [Francisellaceae bacterium]|nr:DoxX family protein [Francisellaceae bacterium]
MDVIAWLVLRIIYAWMFIYPIKALTADWQSTKNTVRLLTPIFVNLSAMMMIAVMFVGGVMILLGVYAQIAGIALCAYCLIGYYIHNKIAQNALNSTIASQISDADQNVINNIKAAAAVGNVTSAQKNIVLAAVGLFFFFMGSGPFSITNDLF